MISKVQIRGVQILSRIGGVEGQHVGGGITAAKENRIRGEHPLRAVA